MMMLVALSAGSVAAQLDTESSPVADTSVDTQLEALWYGIRTLDDLHERGVLTYSEFTAERERYLQQAATLTGESITLPRLRDRVTASAPSWTRLLTVVNVLWAVASLLMVLAFSVIAVRYIFPLLRQVPVIVYEVLLYLLCGAFLYYGLQFPPSTAQFVALPGVIGVALLIIWSYQRRHRENRTTDPEEQRMMWRWYRMLLVLFWGGATLIYQSHLIGWLAVMAFMALLDSWLMVPLLHSAFGPGDKARVPQVLAVSSVMVGLYIATTIAGIESRALDLYRPGVYWFGVYGFFSSLAVISLRYYDKERPRSVYVLWQLIAIGCGIGVLVVGAWWNVPRLIEATSTFFVGYVFAKYVELVNWSDYWAFGLLGIALLLYVCALLITEYPQLFPLM
jgi:hypothetical protein